MTLTALQLPPDTPGELDMWRGVTYDAVLGRTKELETLLDELHTVLDPGQTGGRCLVIEGDPGLGKTTLVDHIRSHAVGIGFRELRCAGVQSQSEIGFAGLHELIHPILDHAERLPSRQRNALLTAFGVIDGAPPERLMINLAVLGLLEEASHERPLLLCVDDAQWLDASTQDVLTFVGRRLGSASVLMLGVTRPGLAGESEHLLGLPRLPLQPLDVDGAETLLNHVLMDTPRLRELPDSTRRRLLGEAGGNPLAIIELAAALAERVDSVPLPSDTPLPTTRRIEQAFLDQLSVLPDSSRVMLLVAATAGSMTLSEIQLAAAELDLSDGDISALEAARLITMDPTQIEVRHPLIRSAVYGAASMPARASVHRALAAATASPARAAWHRAAASYAPDEGVAVELEDVAVSAAAHGAHVEAAAALRRAAHLSPQRSAAARRLAGAAEAFRKAGATSQTMASIDEALTLGPGRSERVQLEITRYVLAAMGGAPGRSAAELASLAERFGAGADDTARFAEAFMLGASSIRWQMYGHDERLRVQIVEQVRRARSKAGATRPAAAILDLTEAIIDSHHAAGRYADQVTSLIAEFGHDPLVVSALSLAAEYTWNLDAAEAGWDSLISRSRELGVPVHECDGLRGAAGVALQLGKLRDAYLYADSALRMAEDVALPGVAASAAATLARACVWRGERDQAMAALHRGRELLRSDTAVAWASHLHWAAGLAALSAGDHEGALRELSQMSAHPQLQVWAVGDLTEAAVAAGRPEAARHVVQRAMHTAESMNSGYLSMLSQRSMALLSTDDADTENRFRTAIAAGRECRCDLELARTQLAFGQWLRRQRRIVDSREPLASAASLFAEAGAHPWADIAKAELRAAGVSVQQPISRDGDLDTLLTAQELQIAELAAQGLTNKEIADRVYLSHRTVGAHLYRVFPKLGITTRGQLVVAMRARSESNCHSGSSRRDDRRGPQA